MSIIVFFISCEFDNFELKQDLNVIHLRCFANRKTFYELSFELFQFSKEITLFMMKINNIKLMVTL